MQPETRFKIKVLKELTLIPDSWFFKTQMLARLGIPDILGCVNGKFVALELKKDKKSKVTKLQKYILLKISIARGYAKIVYPENWENIWEELMML